MRGISLQRGCQLPPVRAELESVMGWQRWPVLPLAFWSGGLGQPVERYSDLRRLAAMLDMFVIGELRIQMQIFLGQMSSMQNAKMQYIIYIYIY